MKHEQVQVSRIELNTANPRTITDKNYRKLVNSILVLPKMLELRPIVVDDAMVVLGGNMRARALQYLAELTEEELCRQLKECAGYKDKSEAAKQALETYWIAWHDKPVCTIVKANCLTDQEKQEFIIKDNVGFGDWDMDALANEWDVEKLNEWGLDIHFDNSGNLNLDDFFDEGEQKEKEKSVVIEVVLSKEMEDNETEIRNAIEAAVQNYDGVKVK